MALPRNKLVPVLAVIGLVIVGFIIWKQVRGGPVKAGPEMTAIPDPGRPDSKALPADADSPSWRCAAVRSRPSGSGPGGAAP